MKLSQQAVASVMLALQSAILKQTNVEGELKSWELSEKNGELWVENPPTFETSLPKDEEEAEETDVA